MQNFQSFIYRGFENPRYNWGTKTAKNYKKTQTKAVFSEIVRTSKRIIFSKILKYLANVYF